MKARKGAAPALERLIGLQFARHQRPHGVVIGGLKRRRHDEAGEKKRQRNDHGIGRRGLQADRGAQERQHHDDARERRHHHEDRGRERQDRDDGDQLDRALGHAAAAVLSVAEADRDVLRKCLGKMRVGEQHRQETRKKRAAHTSRRETSSRHFCGSFLPPGRRRLAISSSRLENTSAAA
jgi:hypothetical protein